MFKKIMIFIFLTSLLSLYAKEIKIGVLAKRGFEKTIEKWGETAKYLNRKIPEYKFKIIPIKFDEVNILVANGLIDFAIVNPAIYINLELKYDAVRILTLKNALSQNYTTKFGSVIFTRSDNKNINILNDIRGKNISAVHDTSLGGWIIALKEFRDYGIYENSFSIDFLNTHDEVVKSIIQKKYDIGIVRSDTLERMDLENKIDIEKLKVLNKKSFEKFPFLISTKLYPEWPLAKIKHTSNEIAKKVSIALMQLTESDEASKRAKIYGWTTPENYELVHSVLKEFKLEPYSNFGEINFIDVIKSYWYWLIIIFTIIFIQAILVIKVKILNRDLKLKQIDLENSKERFKATFEQVAVGIAHATKNGNFLMINQKFCEITKYSEVELKKLNFNDITYQEDLLKEVKLFEDIKNKKIDHFSIQKRYIKKDNSLIWVLSTMSAVRDSNSNIKYLILIIDDISKLKILERDILQEKKQKELILNLAGDGILGLDLEAKHTFVNPVAAKMFGYEIDELIGKNSHKIWHHTKSDGTNFPQSECPITAVLKEGKIHKGHKELFWRKDGSSFLAEYISTPIIEDGEIRGAVVIFREVKVVNG